MKEALWRIYPDSKLEPSHTVGIERELFAWRCLLVLLFLFPKDDFLSSVLLFSPSDRTIDTL